MKKYILFFVLLGGPLLRAQVNMLPAANNTVIYMTNPVQLSYYFANQVDNLLIMISDSTGHTVFLDNRYRFKGSYNRTVDLSKTGIGPYILCVIEDSIRNQTKFFIKDN